MVHVPIKPPFLVRPAKAPASRIPTWIACLALSLCGLTANGQIVRTFPVNRSLRLNLNDDINSPLYSWPRTLLSYPVNFSAHPVRPGQLRVVDVATHNAELPIQLSQQQMNANGLVTFARVNFFSDLTPHAQHSFELRNEAPPPATGAVAGVTEHAVAGGTEIDAGALQVRIPTRGDFGPGQPVPGPILALNRGQGWIGVSHLIAPNHPVEHLEVQRVDKGPLFETYRLTYRFAGGGTYIATVKPVLDYPFVELSEQMNGLPLSDNAAWEMNWTGFSPTRRYPANGWMCPAGDAGIGIDEPVMTCGIIEEPHWFPADRVENPAKEMIYHLASFQGNAPRDAVPAMSFWDDRPGGQELGVFIPDTLTWNDQQYMTWQPTTRLQVRFRHAGGVLTWTYPLVDGTRTTDINFNDASAGRQITSQVRKTAVELAGRQHLFNGNFSHDVRELRLSYPTYLRAWYGGLNLDRVKDWVLTYPADAKPAPAPFGAGDGGKTADDLENLVYSSALMCYPLGLDINSMNIDHRIVRPIVELYTRVQSKMTPQQRQHVNALLLLSAYVNSGEDIAPIRTCATGTPNMSADGFSVPPELGMLFPEHPMGPQWRDQFEKTLQLMGVFYTRPDVPALGSLGGRWCESLATYNWAYLLPTEAGNTADLLTDGRNRFANPAIAARGQWMVDELTAPIYNPNPYWRQAFGAKRQVPPPVTSAWHPGMPLSSDDGFKRQFPAYGAHGSGTAIELPETIRDVGFTLMHYNPLVAEHLLWAMAQQGTSQSGEFTQTVWDKAESASVMGNAGTDPHLHSVKYTGHGIVLRAGVGTPEELSIHLEQVDRGPNYRWGDNGQGSSGTLFFYAQGQPWTGIERENTGDHTNDDTTGNTNFGAVARGEYRSIGENVLDQPLYDMGPVAQFAEITARTGASAYSWPAYKSRSIMLVGTDYFVLADDVEGPSRFSWFQAKDLPFPKLVFLQPLTAREDAYTEVRTAMSKGILRDAVGPSVVLVTHKLDGVQMEQMSSAALPFLEGKEVQQYTARVPRGQHATAGVYHVKTPTSQDRLFRAMEPIHFDENGETFDGTAGVIRSRHDGTTELAMFQGTRIGGNGLTIQTSASSAVGITAAFQNPSDITGMFLAPSAASITLRLDDASSATGDGLYVDGARQSVTADGGDITFVAPAGRHAWELTSQPPTPMAPVVLRTENAADSASVFFSTVAGADRYRLETSRDGGRTWERAGEGDASPMDLHGLTPGKKIHVRVIALDHEHDSAPSAEYPIYVSNQPPAPPDGLDLVLSKDRVDLTWGQVLGVKAYRLYRRTQGSGQWQPIYAGLQTAFSDTSAAGVVPPAILPGVADNLDTPRPRVLYEYCVASADGNGEGARSAVANTDPTGWRNWWPAGKPREYQRLTGYWLPPYVPEAMIPPAHYPTQSPEGTTP